MSIKNEVEVSYKIFNLTTCQFPECSFPELGLEGVGELTLEQLIKLVEGYHVLLDFLNKEIWYFSEEEGEEVLVGNFSY